VKPVGGSKVKLKGNEELYPHSWNGFTGNAAVKLFYWLIHGDNIIALLVSFN